MTPEEARLTDDEWHRVSAYVDAAYRGQSRGLHAEIQRVIRARLTEVGTEIDGHLMRFAEGGELIDLIDGMTAIVSRFRPAAPSEGSE